MATPHGMPGAPPPKPIPLKDRTSIVFVERGQLDVMDGAFVLVDAAGVRTHIPVGGLGCIMLEPGARISHAAVALAARVGTLLLWVGEAGVRLYAAGQPGGARADRLLWQCRLALDPNARPYGVCFKFDSARRPRIAGRLINCEVSKVCACASSTKV